MKAPPGYEVTQFISESSAVQVCRGIRLADGMPVVIKRQRPEATIHSRTSLIRTEYTIGSKIDAPGVVAYDALLEGEDGPILIREDYGDRSLKELAPPEESISRLFFPWPSNWWRP